MQTRQNGVRIDRPCRARLPLPRALAAPLPPPPHLLCGEIERRSCWMLREEQYFFTAAK